jgi:hypothetical protein
MGGNSESGPTAIENGSRFAAFVAFVEKYSVLLLALGSAVCGGIGFYVLKWREIAMSLPPEVSVVYAILCFAFVMLILLILAGVCQKVKGWLRRVSGFWRTVIILGVILGASVWAIPAVSKLQSTSKIKVDCLQVSTLEFFKDDDSTDLVFLAWLRMRNQGSPSELSIASCEFLFNNSTRILPAKSYLMPKDAATDEVRQFLKTYRNHNLVSEMAKVMLSGEIRQGYLPFTFPEMGSHKAESYEDLKRQGGSLRIEFIDAYDKHCGVLVEVGFDEDSQPKMPRYFLH